MRRSERTRFPVPAAARAALVALVLTLPAGSAPAAVVRASRDAAVLDGEEAAGRLNAASAALKAKRFEDALRDYGLVAQHGPDADMKRFAREGVAHTLASRAAYHADSLVQAGQLTGARDSLQLAQRLARGEALRAALKTRSANLEARILLEAAAAHRKAGDPKKARAALAKAEKLPADPKMLAFVRDRLRELAAADESR